MPKVAKGESDIHNVKSNGKNARKVKMEMNGSLACSCSKFERKTSKGKRRIKGPCELALQGIFKKKFRAKCVSFSIPVATSIVRPSPLSVGGDANNLAYYAQPSFITLLQAGYDIGFEDSEASNTDFRLTNNLLLCTKGLDGHKEVEGTLNFKHRKCL
ncbi:uncharacterized protein LOC114299189 isoform X3 [Camellia sinensis]|uniref:uncharacterized protein LOC114299189 isoform X3 n=1 Tax=Camellia sinensis TaxID=4442 RepID=UPI0010357D6B|nr:uncharacterized protein LOC114299189 isoform X3 [Camellia sinensis]